MQATAQAVPNASSRRTGSYYFSCAFWDPANRINYVSQLGQVMVPDGEYVKTTGQLELAYADHMFGSKAVARSPHARATCVSGHDEASGGQRRADMIKRSTVHLSGARVAESAWVPRL